MCRDAAAEKRREVADEHRFPAAPILFSGRYPGWRKRRFTFPRES